MRLIDADMLISNYSILAPIAPVTDGDCVHYEQIVFTDHIINAPTIEAYTIEDLRDAYRDGQDNECSYHWGIRKAEPWYMKDEVAE